VATAPDFELRLRGANLRVTRPRLAVLAAVHAHPHADTHSIIAAVRSELPAVSHQAVYDVLRALTAVGLVRRIQPTTTTSCAGRAVPSPMSTAPPVRRPA
jgi:Fur family ferric uptake transcriptional regulator